MGKTFNTIEDSGVREAFETGSRRDTRAGKGRYDLIPTMFLRRLARHFERGAAKYGDNNWQLGQPLSRYYDSATRHLTEWYDGADQEDHGIAAVWNIMAALWTEEAIVRGELDAALDDRPSGRNRPNLRPT